MNVSNIESGPPLDQHSNDICVTRTRGLVQRCRVCVAAHRVVPVGVFASVKEQSDDLAVPKLYRQRKRAMTVLAVGNWEDSAGIVDAMSGSSHCQVDPRPPADQCVHSLEFTMSERR